MAYLLDTDSAPLAFRGNERVRTHIRQAPAPGIGLSGIATEEIMRGALGLINTNRDKAVATVTYELFTWSLESLRDCRQRDSGWLNSSDCKSKGLLSDTWRLI